MARQKIGTVRPSFTQEQAAIISRLITAEVEAAQERVLAGGDNVAQVAEAFTLFKEVEGIQKAISEAQDAAQAEITARDEKRAARAAERSSTGTTGRGRAKTARAGSNVPDLSLEIDADASEEDLEQYLTDDDEL